MNPITRPGTTEAAEYYFIYINQVGPGDIRDILATQARVFPEVLAKVTEAQSLHRDRPDQWTGRQALNHVNDGERLFVFRAMWFARGFESPLPSFDQNIAVKEADADAILWSKHLEEFGAVRAATITFFQNLPAAAWDRQGTASDYSFTVRALAYITAGHAEHHLKKLRERYSL